MTHRFIIEHMPVLFVVGAGDFDDQVIEQYTKVFTELHERGEPWVVLSDSRWSNVPDSAARKKIAEMSDALSERAVRLVLGTAAILPNRLMAGAATAVGWMVQRKQANVKYFTSAEQGLGHLREAAAKRQLDIPHSALELCRELDALFAQGDGLDSLGISAP